MLKRISFGLMMAAVVCTGPAWADSAGTGAGAVPQNKTRADAATTTREPISFAATPLSDCISYLTDISGININVDWKALEAAGIARDTPITLRLSSNVSLGKTLKLILQQAGSAGVLTSYVDEGVLNITSQAAEDKLLITRIYPIQDLLFQPPDYTGAPQLDISNVQNQSAGGGGGGGSSQSNIFGGSSTSSSTNQPVTQTDRANTVIKMITDTIRPELWQINGGAATIDFFRGNLVVHAPRSVHRLLASQYMASGH